MKYVIVVRLVAIFITGALVIGCSSNGAEDSSPVASSNNNSTRSSSDGAFEPSSLTLEDLKAEVDRLKSELDQVQTQVGPDGVAGANCYDPMKAAVADGSAVLSDFDINEDGKIDVLDCRGAKGDQGEQGPAGITGATGLQGQAGANGVSCFQPLLDELDGGADIADVDVDGDGQIGPSDCMGSNGQACWEGSGDVNGDGIANVQDCRGEDGEDGQRGATGARGSIGPEGDRGPRGFEGPQGIQGEPGRLTLGVPYQVHGYDELTENDRIRTFFNNYDQAVLVTLTAQTRADDTMRANIYIKYPGEPWPSNSDIHMYTQQYNLDNSRLRYELKHNDQDQSVNDGFVVNGIPEGKHFSHRQSHTFVIPPQGQFRIIVDERDLRDANIFERFWIGNVKYTALEP